MMLANYCFFTSMLAFYFAGSRATKVKAAEKKRISSDYKEGIVQWKSKKYFSTANCQTGTVSTPV